MFVTVVTITFNAASFIERTMQSVLCQTSTDYEYVIIDGNSTDRTLEIIMGYISSFQEKGVKIRWISEPDKGIYDAMNKGFKLAQGDYIWFVNAGDTISDFGVLSNILSQIQTKKDRPDFIYGETLIVNSAGSVLGERRLKAPEHLNWKSFRMGMLVCHQSMLVNRVIAPVFNTSYRYSADFDWTIRCLKNAKNCFFTHTVLSHFMDGGVSKTKMRASLKERFHIMTEYYGWLPTTLRHIWFILRASWFKLFHGWF
jgi:glycosyltransferase involved in cell wall biosynthesis